MSNSRPTANNPDDFPFPLLERGDVVRLKDPYEVEASRNLATAVEKTACALVTAQVDPDDLPEAVDTVDALSANRYEDLDSAPPVHTFTHGIIAEVFTRYPVCDLDLPEVRVVKYANVGGGPPRNVALFLFNPDTGLLFLDRGAGEAGRPTFVDTHVRQLVLIQKHNKSYSDCEIDIEAVYDQWGITDIIDTLTDADESAKSDQATTTTDGPHPLISSTCADQSGSDFGDWLSVDPEALIKVLAAETKGRLRTDAPSLTDAIGDTLDAHHDAIWRDLSFVEQMALADQLTEAYDLADAYVGEQASKAPYGTEDWREAVVTGYLWHILDGAIRTVLDPDSSSS